MITFAIYFGFCCFGLALLMNIWRVMFSDNVADRVLALDTMFINTIAILILFGLSKGTEIYFEAVLIIAMLGFISTVAYARFVLRGNIIE